MTKLGARQPRGDARRSAIVAFVRGYWLAKGYAPSLGEVATGVGLRSISSCHDHVGRLVAAGVLAMDRGVQRSLRVVHSREPS